MTTSVHSDTAQTTTIAARRVIDAPACAQLIAAGFDPVLARLLAARGIAEPSEAASELADLIQPDSMHGLAQAAQLLADIIDQRHAICVVGDYDCDGATATAVAVAGLRRLGAVVDFLVPNRFTDGYGLSPNVALAAAAHPRLQRTDCIVTVDNGIASHAGVVTAHDNGMQVVITDHHLPGDTLPPADAIVNPNQPGCTFPSKHLAGVGVAFYVVAAVRAELVKRGRFGERAPGLSDLLEYVAVGTVADLVVLDANNRRLVAAGLARLRSGRARPGLQALMQVAGCTSLRLNARDLGFAIGPRINAAGRLDDITIGIECLLAATFEDGLTLARQLDGINTERRAIEAKMRASALEDMPAPQPEARTVVVTRENWHEGVIGLVAGRLKERWHRPVFALAPAAGEPGTLRGSGRSIPGVHLRDILATIAARQPELITRFGGHAMAAGMSLPQNGLAAFTTAFESVVAELADPQVFGKVLAVDGPLPAQAMDLALAERLEGRIWGQGFAPPLFCNHFDIVNQRVVGNGHLKLTVALDGQRFEAIWFNRNRPLAASATLAYELQTNEYRGLRTLQLLIADEVAPDEASPG